MAAAYPDMARLAMDIKSPSTPDMAFHVEITHGAYRIVAQACDLYDYRGEVFMMSDETNLRS